MRLKLYLPITLVAFLSATLGADIFARISLTGETLESAVANQVQWNAIEPIGILLLFLPFLAVALICALVERRARTRTAAAIFGAAMLTLVGFYFAGFRDAEQASLQHKWTAAALTIGFLPFFIGIPLAILTAGASALAMWFDPRPAD